MNIPFIDLKSQYRAIEDKVKARMQKVLDHGLFIMGPEVAEFESALADFIGCKHVISCGSGTQALTLAMMTAKLKPGSEVITTPFSFFATIDTMINLQLKPVFVDIDRDTFNIDSSLIESKVTDKTSAIVPVSLYGQVADMREINEIAKKHNLMVIEDAAQSCGAPYGEQRSGNLSTMATTSFFPAKSLGAYGDAGAMMTNDESFAKLARELRVHGQSGRYLHSNIGINSRMDTLQAAVLLVKLERYPWEIEQRQRIANIYMNEIKGAKLPVVKTDRGSVWAQFTLRVSDREKFREKLQEKGVPTSVHYPRIMCDQPIMQELMSEKVDLPEARAAAEEVVSLPIFPDMTDEQARYICKSVNEI